MSAAERWERMEGSPAPKPLAALSRVQVAARIAVMHEVLDLLITQADYDGGESFATRGAAKMELAALRAEVQDRDRQERARELSDFGQDLLRAPLEVQLAAVRQSAEG